MKMFALMLCGVIGCVAAAPDHQRSGEADAPPPGGRWIVRLTTSGGIGRR